MKKLFSLLAIAMMSMTAWAVEPVQPASGDGQSGSPYQISSAGNLLWFAQQVNDKGETSIYGELTSDIDMTGVGNDYTPIGSWEKPYTGTFNGNGHRIKNLVFTRSNDKEVGVFGVVSGTTTITKLIVDKSCSFTGTGYGAAGIVGCMARADESLSDAISLTLTGCGNEASIQGTINAAGLVGGVYRTDTNGNATVNISYCYNTGTIKGYNESAAFIGYGNSKVNISKCYNTGKVIGCDENHSLIRYKSDATVTVSDIYNLSTVTKDANAISITAEEFASGKICYLLNGRKSTGNLAWYQTLGTDNAPVLEKTHSRVYYTGANLCPAYSYSNSKDVEHTAASAPNANEEIYCSVCNHILDQKPSQDASGTYLIANRSNLIWFANHIQEIEKQETVNAKLTADIDLGDEQTMIGTEAKPFYGTFDGNNHSITVNYKTSDDYAALFRYIGTTSIYNLTTKGTITTSARQAAGVVANGISPMLDRVVSEVTINSSYSGDASHGGLIAELSVTANITNCAFIGKMLGSNTSHCGGFIGWYENMQTVNITDSYLYVQERTISTTGCKTFARYRDKAPYITNCYYILSLGDTQGEVFNGSTASGDLCYKLNRGTINGSQGWYQNIDNGQDVDELPVFDKTHGTIYGGEDQCPLGEYSNTQKFHICSASEAYNGVGVCDNLNCTHEGYQPASLVDGTYQIANKGNLIWFAMQVKSGQTGINGKLTADIDMGDSQAMIGVSNHKYSGTFDGDKHTVTVNYVATAKNTALFSYVDGATIQNLATAGSISTNYQQAAGIVAESYGTTHISRCASSVTITSTHKETALKNGSVHGGIVAHSMGTTHLTDVLFNGKLLGEDAYYCGGFVGYSENSVSISNSLFNPSEVTFNTQDACTMSRGRNVTMNNCYYSATLGEAQGMATTAEKLASGEICYKLNGGKIDDTMAWYQTLGTDAAPVLFNRVLVVFGGASQCGGYDNQQKSHVYSTSAGDDAQTCEKCGKVIYSTPSKDASGNYLLRNKGNLLWFAQQVNCGATSTNAKLTANIDLGDDQTMIGTNEDKYAGTFNGDGHTVTVNYTATENNTALFRYVYAATIENLTTAGSISTGYQFAGGIVAESHGATHIDRCASSVAITSTYEEAKDGTIGGIVGNNQGEARLTNALFNGKLLGENAINCGGLIGYSRTNTTIAGCWFNPSEVTFSTSGANTLSRGSNVTAEFCYYSATLGGVQGTPTTEARLTSGEMCYKLNGGKEDGTQAWYQTLGTDPTPVLASTHGTVYGGPDQCGTYSNEQKAHTISDTFDSDGEKICSVCNYAVHQQPQQDASGTYLLANRGNLGWFAEQVNGGDKSINGRLTADIDLGNEQIMIGTSDSKYSGTFDGDGHTVTVNYTATEDFTALFRFVTTTTINNLRTAGSISTGYRYAAGIVGYNKGTSHIEKCASSVAITSTFDEEKEGTHAGILAYSDGIIYLINTLFNGKLLGPNATDCCGMVGYANAIRRKFCLFAPEEVTVSDKGATTIGWGSLWMDSGSNDCYYTKQLGEVRGWTEKQVTEEQVCTGEVCNMLNELNYVTVWSQTLEKDACPAPGTAGIGYERTMANKWGTIVLPFDVTYDQAGENYKFFKLSEATVNGNQGTLTFEEYEDGTIPAGTPMVVKAIGEKGTDGKYTISIPSALRSVSTDITEQNTENASLPDGWTMKGTYSNLSDKTGLYYIASNQFWWAEKAITIAPFRAWFTGPEPANNVKAFSIVVDDEATGIGEIDGTSYMSNGTSGKFLENGKVVIVRNGRKYNTLGTTVR